MIFIFVIFLFLQFENFSTTSTVNIALYQNYNQASIYSTCNGSHALDGIPNPLMNDCNCLQTKNDDTPWFIIQLEKLFLIQRIRLLYRNINDRFLQKLFINTKLSSDISNIDLESFRFFAYMGTSILGAKSISFDADNKPHLARIVLFYLDYKKELVLCEVEMWSLNNIGKHKRVMQSGSYGKGPPALSVDDHNQYHYNFGCSHTTPNTLHSWWRIDLEQENIIYAVCYRKYSHT